MPAKGKTSLDQLPLFVPPSEWKPPDNLPDLSRETEVAIDIETKDPSLSNDKGPGFYCYEKTNHNTGFICGISVAWRDSSVYIPLRHFETTCFEFLPVFNWLRRLAAQNYTRFIFHNFQYDWGWIEAVFRIPPPLLLDDTMAMASMINENLESFSLDNLCIWQGLEGKEEALLKDALGTYRLTGKGDLWKLPGKYVGPYAEQDAASTLALSKKLRPLLTAEKLDGAYQVERDLFPITLTMKQKGIRVDLDKATKLSKLLKAQADVELSKLKQWVGTIPNIHDLRKNRWLTEQFARHNIRDIPKTDPTDRFPDGQDSFDKIYLSRHPHDFPKAVHKIRNYYDLAEKFLDKFILSYAHNGRVYPSVNQFRSETGGARSHRFSYSDPPLQQMPSRDAEYANQIRDCFLPEPGEYWCSIDYRQQEYRLIVFTAELQGKRGAEAAANMYRTNPDTDFHDYVAKLTRLPRKRAKDVNFATSYGAGVTKFSEMTGLDIEESREIMEQYYRELPFVREVSNHYRDFALDNGYIEMLDGARNHFNLWEPRYRDFAKEQEFKKKDKTINLSPCVKSVYDVRYRSLLHPWHGEVGKRAYCHKAFNRIIQGSAARQIKRAMIDLWNAGYPPLLQIHDELAFSLVDPVYAKTCAKIMEECMPQITIPMLTDVKIGSSWGDLKK